MDCGLHNSLFSSLSSLLSCMSKNANLRLASRTGSSIGRGGCWEPMQGKASKGSVNGIVISYNGSFISRACCVVDAQLSILLLPTFQISRLANRRLAKQF